jgi:hypothetical protein
LTGSAAHFVIDFGSAGIDAFKDLLNVLARIGVMNVTIG